MKLLHIHRSNVTKRDLPNDFKLYTEAQRELLSVTIPHQSHQAGQDRIVSVKGILDHPSNLLLMALDGHGLNGHHHSYVGGNLMLKNLGRILPLIYKHLRDGHQDRVEAILRWCFRHTESQMYQTGPNRNRIFPYVSGDSGTTVSVVLLLHISGQRVMVTSNAGDSPIYLLAHGQEAVECGRDHNCDNRDAVEDYLKHLVVKRQFLEKQLEEEEVDQRNIQWRLNALNPRIIYWNRFNTDSPQAISVPQFTGPDGLPAPLPVWKYSQDAEGTPTVSVDLDSYEQVSQFFPIGLQSRKYPPTRTRPDGREVSLEGREAENWGSTLVGRGQNLRGLGDEYEHEHVPCDPYVSIQNIKGPATLLVASDGLSDLDHTQALMDKFASFRHHAPEVAENCIYEHLLSLADSDVNAYYPHKIIHSQWYPKWDDLSGLLVYLE